MMHHRLATGCSAGSHNAVEKRAGNTLPRYGWMILSVSILAHALLLGLLPGPAAALSGFSHLEINVRLNPPAIARGTTAAPLAPPARLPDDKSLQPSPATSANPHHLQPVTPTPASKPAQFSPQTPEGSPGAGALVGAGGDGASGGDALYSGSGGGGTGSVSGNGSGKPDAAGVGNGGTGSATPAYIPPAPPPVKPAPKPQHPPEPALDIKALLSGYAGKIKSAIVRRKDYPAVAERLGHEGAVKVGFTVDANGELGVVSIKSSSGYDELDDAAMAAVRAAAPFDPIPPEAQKEQLSLSITLNFNLGT
jgi:TonB family protein